jgi:hypothetical protein
VDAVRVEAWRVHDTGLVAVPTQFRRLRGQVRHLQGRGDPWPDRVVLEVVGDELRVSAADREVGAWSLTDVTAARVGDGPPVSFALTVPHGSHLLAAAADAATAELLDALTR